MLLSGGIDSATCVYLAKKRYLTCALTFSFHGIAEGELRAAKAVAKVAEVEEHRLMRLPDLRESGDIGLRFKGLPATYIPMRNAVFYSLAASFAEEVGADFIVGGHNRDDTAVFRDSRKAFFECLEESFRAGSEALEERHLSILRPLNSKTKPQVIRLAASLGVPFQLTWSCHRSGTAHCWKCEGCLGRVKSFVGAGTPDPLRAGSYRGKFLKASA